MTKRVLTFASGPYDRMQALFDGTVELDGYALQPRIIQRPVELFSRMLEHREFDIAEMSLTHCFVLHGKPGFDFVSIPVFPSRMFRHGFIFINRNAGIRSPQDLAGKRIGVQGHQMTAAVWIRGLLRDSLGVNLDSVQWYEGGVNEAGVVGGETMQLRPLHAIDTRQIGKDQTLSDMLASGEIDALIGAFIPRSFGTNQNVVRLFAHPAAVEKSYYQETGIFPIMHGLILRREVFEQNPDIAGLLVQACEQAKQRALQRLAFSGALAVTLPWLMDHVEETHATLGADPWPYGLRRNRPTLEAFGKILHADGFTPEVLKPDDIFVGDSL